MHVVTTPIANLRREPIEHHGQYTKDPLQETQLLFGESLFVLKEVEGWAYVEAVEQQKFSGSWSGYPGWIQKRTIQKLKKEPQSNIVVTDLWVKINDTALSFGTKLEIAEEHSNSWSVKLLDGTIGTINKSQARPFQKNPYWRSEIVSFGKKFLDFPYLWGGRSAYDEKQATCITSVDCSGYVQLLYRAARGIDIPRDAHDQFLKAEKTAKSDLLPGDLIFLEPIDKPGRMNHVMMYAGDGYLLEATMASKNVRLFPLETRLTVDCPYHVHFGRIN